MMTKHQSAAARKVGETALRRKEPLHIREHVIEWGTRTYVMGIINVTPDSFAKDGCLDSERAAAKAIEQVRQGASIIDFGGQSTRPGHTPISAEEEASRVIPAIKSFRAGSKAIVSIDTFDAGVAKSAIEAGADVVNCIWGAREELLGIAATRKLPMIIMHNKREAVYESVVDEVIEYLHQHAKIAVAAGIAPNAIILDPGIGFGKTPEHNMQILASLDRLVALGFPTLLGTSRKSTIGKLTGKTVEHRQFGTAATVALAIAAGVDIVRVHDVSEMIDVARVSDAIVRGWRPSDWGST